MPDLRTETLGVTQEVEPRMSCSPLTPSCWLLSKVLINVQLFFSLLCSFLATFIMNRPYRQLWILHLLSLSLVASYFLLAPPSPWNTGLSKSHLLLLFSVPIAFALWFLHQQFGSCLGLECNFCSNIFHVNFLFGACCVSLVWTFVGIEEGDRGWYLKSQVYISK